MWNVIYGDWYIRCVISCDTMYMWFIGKCLQQFLPPSECGICLNLDSRYHVHFVVVYTLNKSILSAVQLYVFAVSGQPMWITTSLPPPSASGCHHGWGRRRWSHLVTTKSFRSQCAFPEKTFRWCVKNKPLWGLFVTTQRLWRRQLHFLHCRQDQRVWWPRYQLHRWGRGQR